MVPRIAMVQLPKSLAAWGGDEFPAVLKAEVERLDPATLPLQRGIEHGSHYSGKPFTVMVIATNEEAAAVRVRIGLFYTSIIAGCNCADDPTPMDEYAEYCEVELVIDKVTAAVEIPDGGVGP